MRRRPRRIFLAIAFAVLAAVAVVLLSLPWLVDLPRVHALLESEASRLLDRPVRFDRVALRYWPLPAIQINGLVIVNPPGFDAEPLLSVATARVRVRLLPLLRGRLQLGEITLARPRVVVEQRRDGTWNLPAPGGAPPTPAAPLVLVSRVRLRDGHVEIRIPGDGGRRVSHVVDHIDLGLEDLGWSAPIRFVLAARLLGGGLSLSVEGQVGPLAAAGSDLAAVPARLAARFVAQDAQVPAEAGLAVSGTGEGEVRAEGPLGRLEGGGRLAFSRLTLVHRPDSCGARPARPLTVEGLELPIRIAGSTLSIQPFAFRLGGGAVRGDAVLTFRAATPSVRLSDVRVQRVPAESVLVDFLCQPYAVSGPLDGTGEVAFAGTGDELRRSARGAWHVRVGPGRLVGPAALTLVSGVVQVGTALYAVTNLDVPASLFTSPLEFDSLTVDGALADERLRVRDARLASRHVRVTGQGDYGLSDTRLDLVFNVQAGRTGYAVRVQGTAAKPSFTPLARGVLQGLTDVLAPLIGPRRSPGR
ncbi:MAG: AsmA family protein [Candidatus Rokuibacteriota bacterium]